MSKTSTEDQIISMMKRPIPRKKVGIVKLKMIREKEALYSSGRFHDARTAAELVRPVFALADREMLVVLSLDAVLVPIAMEIVAVGGVCSCNVDTRDIFKHAVLSNAVKIICFHNHPSGNLEASREDSLVTRQIKDAGKLLGIELIDHIIIGLDDAYISFKEKGIYPFEKENGAA